MKDDINTNNSLENAKIVNEYKQNQNLLKKETTTEAIDLEKQCD